MRGTESDGGMVRNGDRLSNWGASQKIGERGQAQSEMKLSKRGVQSEEEGQRKRRGPLSEMEEHR